MDAQAILLSLRLASTAALLSLPLALPLAWLIAFGRFRGKVLLETVVTLPLVLPPTVLGFYLLAALGPGSPVGRAWQALTGGPLVFSFSGLVVALVLANLPFLLQPLVASLAAVSPRQLEAAATLGAGPLRRYLEIALPLAWRGLAAGLVLAFAHGMGEFGMVLMIGANLPGQTRTASIALYDQVQALDYAAAHRTAMFLLAVAFLVLLLSAWLRSREARWHRG
ncbi:MAG TPA: molybdate ABC transporter permease subunit [Holophagaceae bacterium]|nr:molybdate ABC transporter permease subunit [Holophagaceae bacterium]